MDELCSLRVAAHETAEKMTVVWDKYEALDEAKETDTFRKWSRA